MFMGIAAPYCGLSHTSRILSPDPEQDDRGNDVPPFSTSMGCSNDQDSLSSDQDVPEFPKHYNSRKIRRQIPQAQGNPLTFRPRTADFSCISPHSNLEGLAHQGCLSTNTSYSIKGLDVAQSCPQAMFRPIIRVYPPPYGRQAKSGPGLDYLRASHCIEHLDATTVWKGLLLADAERLVYLQRTFKDSLEDLLADALENVHKEFQQQCASYHNLDIGVLVKSSLYRQLSFTLSHLVLSMSQRLELCGKLLEQGLTRDFMMLLPLYLISCDSLMGFEGDRVGDTAVEICVHYCDPSNHTIPLGPVYEAAWIPDMLSFNEIHQIQREGQELIIIPRYCGNAAFTADITRTNVQFFIEPPVPWLLWDKSISGFRGNVPLFSEMGGCLRRLGKVYGSPRDGPYATINVLRVEIKALLTAGYGSPIRLERTIRARLTFKIVPWFAHDSACAPTDDLVRPFSFPDPERDSPAPSSKSSRLGGKLEHESPLGNNVSNDANRCVNSRSSRASSTERLPAATSLQSSRTSPRKRRATSSLEIPSPTKRHRENDNQQPVIGLSNPRSKDLSNFNIQEETDECWSRSTKSDGKSSCSVWSLHSQNYLSPMRGDIHIGSSDIDEAPEVKHLIGDSVDTIHATSSLEIPSPTKRHRENDNKQSVIGLSNSHNKDFSNLNIQEEVDECWSRSTTSDGKSSCCVWSLHSQNYLSPMLGDIHIGSSDIDEAPEVKHLEEDPVDTIPFDENPLALAAENKSLDSVHLMHVTHEKSDVEASSTQQGILSSGQDIPPRNNSLDENLINEISQLKWAQREELCNPKSRTSSETGISISAKSESSHDRLYSPISISRKSSVGTEFIIENPEFDSENRREKAILWRILSIREEQGRSKGETMCMHELRDMYAAMKLSAAEGKEREMAKVGLGEVLDDIFIASGSGSDMDGSDDASCPQGNSEASGGLGSG